MRSRFATVAVVGCAAFALSHLPASAFQSEATTAHGAATTAARTTWDGVYSETQATKGDMVYTDKCEKCHGTEGSGAGGPALAGPEFAPKWDGLSVGELFERTKTTMPWDDPGSLTNGDTAAVVAWTLKKNGFPAGSADLPSSADALKTIQFKSAK